MKKTDKIKIFDDLCKYLFDNKGYHFYMNDDWKIVGKTEIDFTDLFPYKPIISPTRGFKITPLRGQTMSQYGELEIITVGKNDNFSSSYNITHYMNACAMVLPFFDFEGFDNE